MKDIVQNEISNSLAIASTCNQGVLEKSNNTGGGYFDFCSSHIRSSWFRFLKNTFQATIDPKHYMSLVQSSGCAELDKVKELFAKSPDTPGEILELICKGATENVLEAVAENSNATPEILASLARHKSSQVRLAVADHPSTPIGTIWKLVEDDCLDIPYRLAENPNLPHKVLTSLCSSDNPYVQDRAMRTMERIIVG